VNRAAERKMNKEISWYEYDFNSWNYRNNLFTRTQEVHTIATLDEEVKNKEVIIVPSKMAKLGKMLVLLEHFKPSTVDLKIVFVSDENTKHFMLLGGMHITNYFRTLNTLTGELMIGEKLVELNTAYQFMKLKEKYSDFSYCSEIISNLSTINQEKYDSFNINGGTKTIRSAMISGASDDVGVVEEILGYLDSLAEFQKTIETKDKEAIATKAMSLFDTKTVHNIYAYDKDYIDHVEEEMERLSVISPIIRNIGSWDVLCTPLLELLVETIHKNKND